MKLRNRSLFLGLIVLSSFCLKVSACEKYAEYLFKKASGNIKSSEDVERFHAFNLGVHTISKVTLGVSGFICATSLLLTYKKMLSEGKSGEWKGTKITAGIMITMVSGVAAGGSYFVKEVSGKLIPWTSSQFNFVKKCTALKLKSLLQ